MDIVHNFRIESTAQQVFDALTTETGIRGWWCGNCTVPQQVGEVLVVRFTEYNVVMGFRIEEMETPFRLTWRAVENGNPAFLDTVIHFNIEQLEGEVQFSFSHTNWDEIWKGKPNYEQSRETWKHFMKSLRNYLEKGEGQPW